MATPVFFGGRSPACGLPFARKVGNDFFIMERGHLQAEGPMGDLSDSLVKQYLSV